MRMIRIQLSSEAASYEIPQPVGEEELMAMIEAGTLGMYNSTHTYLCIINIYIYISTFHIQ
jgi:hypothetical protein